MKNIQPIRVGVVGCGAAAELVHLPALKKFRSIRVCAFADSNIIRAKQLAAHFPKARTTADYTDLARLVDAVIITSPNYLHAPQTIFYLQHGIHVFCEKPMATTLSDASRMVHEAQKNRRVLSIGMVRRYFTVYEHIKQLLDSKSLGKVTSFFCEEGYPFKWPLQSTYAFEKSKGGGGVLMDLGSHVVDLLAYLFDDIRVVGYRDDSYGGVEANCTIDLSHKGVHGSARLSRERTLKNMLSITCEQGLITSSIPQYSDVTTIVNGQTHVEHIKHDGTQMVYKELSDFFNSSLHEGSPLTSGESVMRSIEMITQCYAIKKPINEPWLNPKI